MTIRPHMDRESEQLLNVQGSKLISRIYLLWLVGIIIGAVELKATDVSVGGVRYTVENPDILQGIVFVAVFLHYLALLIWFVGAIATIVPSGRRVARQMIYYATGKRRTLINISRRERETIKRKASAYYLAFMLACIALFFLPLLHIIFYHGLTFVQATEAIFGF